METILIVLDSRKLENPDLDIRYALPDLLQKYTQNEICDNGYDYITNEELGIWLAAKSAKESYGKVLAFFEEHLICRNNLTETVKIYISDKEAADLKDCTLVYDGCANPSNEETRAANRTKKTGNLILKLASLLTENDTSIAEDLAKKIFTLSDTNTQWQTCVKLLTDRHFLCYCNLNLSPDNFMEMLAETASVKANQLSVERTVFDDEGDLFDWCDALDEQWKDAGFCMATFEAEDDDDNLMFPYKAEALEDLSDLAKEIGVRIVAVAEY
ncbi:MAG: hypothetical protein K2N90_07530 [Lachnospiraceae bacterium]|nr:hypothetical protein [Lachnospiraceae bacterium]